MPPSRREQATAAELKQELDDRYRDDPVYKARLAARTPNTGPDMNS